jgi:tRNA (cytidine/uridine-2'-O-)-methyltransferase
MGFKIDDKKLKRAGLDYWYLLDITYYPSIDDFFSKNDGNFYFLTTKGRQIYSDARFEGETYIIFGKETKGLPEELLKAHPDECLRVPMISDARSLNLSNTVALVGYEVLRQWGFEGLLCEGELHNLKW